MAAVVLGISLSVTSCSDDDDDANKSEQTRDDVDLLDNDEARTAFRWLCGLTDAQTIDNNWKSKTWEPTVGLASENNEYTRIVVVDDLAEAKICFSKLADKDPSELGSKVTVNGGAAGTMTWEPSAAGAQNLAVVTVNSRILPHLQKIVYCTEEQVGANGSIFGNDMKGVAYYRFGDVIQDPEGYYWVCVRPSFAANHGECKSKGDSHWINIFNASNDNEKTIPDENVISKWNNLKKYDYQTILLPTKLPYDRQQIFNLNNLLRALVNPDTYGTINSVGDNLTLGGFPYKYHGKNFVEAVATYWNEPDENGRTIWQKLFNHTYEEMKGIAVYKFLYMGYSWKWGESGYVYCYKRNGFEREYIGKESDDELDINFVKQGFNIRYFAQEDAEKKAQLPWERSVTEPTDDKGTEATWVIRYKKGEQLMTAGKYGYYRQIASKDGKQKDVYRFNEKQHIDAGENDTVKWDEKIVINTEVEKNQAKVGDIIAANGKFYKNESDIIVAKTKPVALVVYIGNDADASAQYRGLACAYGGSEDLAWGKVSKDTVCIDASEGNIAAWAQQNDGISRTTKLATDKHEHPAAQYAYNYSVSGFNPTQYGFSRWFLPTVGQYLKMVTAMGCTYKPNIDESGYGISGYYTAENKIKNKGAYNFNFRFSAWTSTEYSATHAIYVELELGGGGATRRNTKTSKTQSVRPFIAF